MAIENAKREVNDLFKDISPMVLEITDRYSKELDSLINKIADAKTLTNDELRDYILRLSIESYMFGMSKEASILKQECAETLMKEKVAQEFNLSSGSVAVRNNISTINTTDKQVVNLLYGAVANMMKTKLDEAHRLINALNSILISRNAEAKLAVSKNELENGKVILNE